MQMLHMLHIVQKVQNNAFVVVIVVSFEFVLHTYDMQNKQTNNKHSMFVFIVSD